MGWFPPSSDKQMPTILFQVYLDLKLRPSSDKVLRIGPRSSLGNWVHQGTQPTLVLTCWNEAI